MGGRQATITNTRHEAGIGEQGSSVEGSTRADAEETQSRDWVHGQAAWLTSIGQNECRNGSAHATATISG